jgi:hypothetical protein
LQFAIYDDKSIRNLSAILCWESAANIDLKIIDNGGSVAKNILATFHSRDELVSTTTSCVVSEYLQQIPFYCCAHSGRRRLRLKTATSRKLFWNCPLGRSTLTLLSGVAHNPALQVSESGIFYC